MAKDFGESKFKRSSKVIFVRLEYDDTPRRIPATHAVEEHGRGSLTVYDGKDIVARFAHDVRNWWTEEE